MEKRKVLKRVAHFAIVGIIITSSYPFFGRFEPTQYQVIKSVIFNTNLVLFYWLNVSVLIPKFIHSGEYRKYGLSLFSIFIFVMAVVIILNNYLPDPPPPFRGDMPKDGDMHLRPKNEFPINLISRLGPTFFLIPHAFKFLVMIGFGTTLELISLFDKERKRNDEMEKEKAIGELNFLKNQLNPHFLLNALNNIYSLARKKSDDTTEAVLLLSDLLRHVLYESGKARIAISQEIEFIKNYINLEKLKFSEDNAPNVNFSVAVKNLDYPIEPLLLMTLVENAFKHGISYMIPSFILISLEENEKEIRFSVVNSMPKRSMEPSQNTQKGLGIKSLEKQLELIYPGKHSFSQRIENNLFKSFLTIKK